MKKIKEITTRLEIAKKNVKNVQESNEGSNAASFGKAFKISTELVAAVVVGGVNIFGGSGSIFGAVLGAVIIDLLENSLIRWLQISEFWRDAMLGILILASVATDSVIMKRFRDYRLKKLAQTNS